MSFWRGVANVLQEKDQQDYESRERQKQRDYQTLEKKEDRAYEERMFMKKVNEERRTALYSLLAKRKAEEQAVDPEAIRAQGWVMSNLGGIEGSEELLAAAQADPWVAVQIMNDYETANKARAKEGYDQVDFETVVGAYNTFGIRNTNPADILDYNEMFARINEVEPGTPEYYELMAEIEAGSDKPIYGLNKTVDLSRITPDELLDKQQETFDKEILRELEIYETELARTEDESLFGVFTDLKKDIELRGPKAGYKLLGRRVAERLKDDQRFTPERISGNSVLREFFIDEPEPATQPDLTEATPEPTETMTPPVEAPPAPTEDRTEAMPPPEVMQTAKVVPKEITIEGEKVDISEVPSINPEIIEEYGISYEDWFKMSRTEKKEAGLPTSEIGWQIVTMNRDGAYDPLINGWDLLKKFASGEMDIPKTVKEESEGQPYREFETVGSMSSFAFLVRAIQAGEIKTGDEVMVDGTPIEVTEELVSKALGK